MISRKHAQVLLKEFRPRMNRSLALVFTLTWTLVLQASGQPAAAPANSAPTAAAGAQEPKVAVIAFQVAVARTNEGQRSFADVQKKYDPKRQQLKTLNDEIDNLSKQLQAQGTTLNDTERNNRAKTIDDKKKQLQREAEDAQNDMQQEMQELYGSLASKVYDVLNDYVKERGYTLVLDFAQQQSPVLYATPTSDITQAVVDAYNAKSGVPAPPAQSAAPPPAPTPNRPPAAGAH